jgi:two-component system sensor histidine kinase CpxA
MKPASSLYVQIFSQLFVFLMALVAIGFIAFNAHFGIGWEALLNSPLGDRVEAIVGSLDTQLWSTSSTHWNEILQNAGNLYGAKFYVFDFTGAQIAGDAIALPQVVKARFVEPHFGQPDMLFISPAAAKMSGTGDGLAKVPEKRGLGFTVRTIDGAHAGGVAIGKQTIGQGVAVHGFAVPCDSTEQATVAFAPVGPPTEFNGRAGGPPMPKPLHGEPGGPPMPDPFHGGPDGPRGFHEGPGDLPMLAHFQMETGGPPPMPPPPHMVPGDKRILVHSEKPDKFWFVARLPVMAKSGWPIPGAIIASPNSMWQTGLLIDFSYVAFVALVVVALSLLFWCPLIYQITKALSDVTAATKSIAEGDFAARVTTKRRDEIGRLADAVNAMAERLETFITRQRRLLGDISHELVSPIARLQMALELLSVSIPAEKASLVEDINEEVVEMTNLVNELLAYSKAGVKGPDIELLEVNLKELFDKLVDRLDQQKIIDCDVPEDVTVLADPILIERSFANILRNSIRYAGDCGPISVRVPVISSHVAIVISDKGPGVSEEALKYLAEPFYRPEFSRSRDTGGVGLGLAIVKTCVEACGGSLSFRNRLSGGFEVEVRLKHRPLRASEKKPARQISV